LDTKLDYTNKMLLSIELYSHIISLPILI